MTNTSQNGQRRSLLRVLTDPIVNYVKRNSGILAGLVLLVVFLSITTSNFLTGSELTQEQVMYTIAGGGN